MLYILFFDSPLEQQSNTSPDLEALSERLLAQLHLGKQAPAHKAAKKKFYQISLTS
nr:hypothetical protein [Nostoc sp. ZfuVER08]